MFFTNLLKVTSAIVLTTLFAFLLIFVTSVPEVTYSTSKVEYKNGYPDIQVWDIVQVKAPNGTMIPKSEWKTVLAGRYDPVPKSD